ncbi:MAG: hypothetical protein R3B67_02710 [Phycisphaerales bacterium]
MQSTSTQRDSMMKTTLNRYHHHRNRRGNLLVGCTAVLAVVIVLGIIATVFVVRSYRGWVATGIEKGVDATLVELEIDDSEQEQIKGHVATLLEKYKTKQIDNVQFFGVFEKLVDSPLVAAAMVGVIDKLYIDDSGLSEDEKTHAAVQLRRYAMGLSQKDISANTLESVLASVSTDTPDDNDIRMQYQAGPGGTTEYALRSQDEVSDDDLRELIAQAMAEADAAGIQANPAEIDLSDTIGVAMANALGEDPADWVPGYELPAPAASNDDSDADTDPMSEPEEPADDQGP